MEVKNKTGVSVFVEVVIWIASICLSIFIVVLMSLFSGWLVELMLVSPEISGAEDDLGRGVVVVMAVSIVFCVSMFFVPFLSRRISKIIFNKFNVKG